jgi:sec-independent protein translocase protein TatB
MFDISFTEMLIISIVALIVIGPERLPRVARTIGHLLGRARRFVDNVKNDVRHEIELDELRRLKNSVQETTQSIEQSVRKEFNELQAAADISASETSKKPALTEIKQNNALSEDTSAAQHQSSSSPQTPESNKGNPMP